MTKNKNINFKDWVKSIKKLIERESLETQIAFMIFIKVIQSYKNSNYNKPTKQQIYFLKKQSKDLLKILALIITRPLPIPYLFICFALKSIGINLFPSKDGLEIPEEYKNKNKK
jgi:hypothetical protein